MIYVYACVVGIKASLCYLLMYINPTLNKDYLLTYFITYIAHTKHTTFKRLSTQTCVAG
jgi:hypothetical protein